MSKGILRKIRKEFRYREYLEDHLSIKHVPNGEIRVCCPHPSCDDYKYKLYVNDDKKVFKCFKCGFSNRTADVFDLVAHVEGIPRGKAMMKLAREYTEVTPDWSQLINDAKNQFLDVDEPSGILAPIRTLDKLPTFATLLTEPVTAENKAFWDYLLDRGLTREEILAIKTHVVIPPNAPLYGEGRAYRGNLGRRVVLPVYGGDNKLVSWISRTILPDVTPKYFNAPKSDISKTFWPYVEPAKEYAVIVEGVFDALAVRRAGFSAYASFGKALSASQISTLKSWNVEHVTLFWDKRDAMLEMRKTIEDLKMHFSTITVPDFKDWPQELDAGDSLGDGDLFLRMQDTLANRLITVDTWEYIRWLSV